ncbi:MAG: D-alanine--D-alanine ligase [Pseudomonadota bacterium]
MKEKLRVALISGGKSAEREVSLKSGAQVRAALDPEKYLPFDYDPKTDLHRLMADAPNLDVALIILHGRFGEDGTLQGFLDLAGLPYQGSGVMSSALCMDKRATKQMYRFHGLPAARDVALERGKKFDPENILEQLGLPLAVKPCSEGSSIGISLVRTAEGLAPALAKAFELDRFVLVEEFIEGREITASVLGNDELEALELIEIIPGGNYEFFDYEAKYKPGASREVCPALLDATLARQAKELGLRAHQALFCRGYSRTDMIVARDGAFYLLETNTLPGMTETSLFPQAAAASGLPFPRLLDRLIELALADVNKCGGVARR